MWTVDGVAAPGLERCVDLAWLDVAAGTLEMLPQRYERGTEATYWYEASARRSPGSGLEPNPSRPATERRRWAARPAGGKR